MHGLFRLSTASHEHSDSADRHHGHRHGNHHHSSSAEPRSGSHTTHVSPQTSRSGSARQAYPEALPSALSKRFTGPAVGTAVLDENDMPLEDAAIIFEMVTPESTPLLQSHVKERFEAAIEEVVEERRHEAKERTGSSTNTSGADTTPEPSATNHTRENTATHFKVDESILTNPPSTASRHHRRHVLQEGGYVVFTDSYLSAHPNSVVTGLTSELQLTGAEEITPFHHRPVGPDAEKQRLQEVKDYIKEAEHEYRPLFRRRASDHVYGRANYLQSDSPNPMNADVYYATPISASEEDHEKEHEKDASASDIKKSKNTLRKVLSSPFL